jgi:excisionase family DNA binding protein
VDTDCINKPVLLRVRQAAALMSLPISSAYALVNAGKLPVVRLGKRSMRIPRAAVEQLVQEALAGRNLLATL